MRGGGREGARERWNVPDWRDESAYPKPGDLPDELWRWEFIRRMPDYRAAWSKAAEREYEILCRIASESSRDLSRFLTSDSLYFTLTHAVYSSREEFHDILKYRNHPFPNPRLDYHQLLQSSLVTLRYNDQEGGTLIIPAEPIAREVRDLLFPDRILIEFDLMEPGGPQFARARARFERLQRDYAKKLNSSDRLTAKLRTRRRNDKWPRYLRVLDAVAEGVTYEEIGKELKGLARAGLEIEGMSQKQVDVYFSEIERAKSDAYKWHTAALRVANSDKR